MGDVTPRPASRGWALAQWSAVIPAAYVAFTVVGAWARRIAYPFDLEWMEGGMLVHALRLSRGEPLYVAPTADWIPYVYPPGYASVVAALSTVVPLDYPLGRAVSAFGTLLACAAIVAFGARRGQVAAGLVGAAAFLGTWPFSGAFFDLVRPDGLAAGLLAWVFVLVTDRRRGTAVAAGLTLAAAFLVKHNVAALGLPLALWIWARHDVRRAFAFGLSAAVPAGAFAAALEARSGHFLDYLLRVPATHPHDWERLFPGTPGELAAAVFPALMLGCVFAAVRLVRPLDLPWRVLAGALGGLAALAGFGASTNAGDAAGVADAPPWVTGLLCGALLAVGAFACVHLAVRRRASDRAAFGLVIVGGTLLAVVGVMRSHNGGFANVLIPAHLAACFAFPVAAAGLRGPLRAVGIAAAWAQLAVGAWALDARSLVPDEADYAAVATVQATLRRDCDGPILSPYAPWLPHQVGQEPGFHLIALWDIAHPDNPFRPQVREVEKAAKAHRWVCVVWGGGRKLGFGVDKNYPKQQPLRLPARAMMPKTGWRVRPTAILLPAESE